MAVSKKIPNLGRLDATPLQERVYEQLKKALMSGKFEPGQKLTVRAVANSLGTSPMPVRAALARLLAEKALTQLPSGTVVVPRLSREEFTELMTLRVLLEGEAAERSAKTMTVRELKQLKTICAELTNAARANDIDTYLDKNRAFKFAIYQHAGSEALLHLLEILWLRIGPFLRQYTDELSEILEIDYHDDAVEALFKKDGKTARRAIERDIAEGRDFLLTHALFTQDG